MGSTRDLLTAILRALRTSTGASLNAFAFMSATLLLTLSRAIGANSTALWSVGTLLLLAHVPALHDQMRSWSSRDTGALVALARLVPALSSAVTLVTLAATSSRAPALALLIAHAFVMISTFRFGAAWYAALSALAGVIAGSATASLVYGLTAFIGVSILFAVVNYPIQLVLDHAADMRRLKTRKTDALAAVRRAVLILAPALLLTVVGFKVHAYYQREAKLSLYRLNYLALSDQSAPDTASRDMRADVAHTLHQTYRKDSAEAEHLIRIAFAGAASGADSAVARTEALLNSLRPSPIDAGPCQGFRIKRLGSFRSPCRALISSINRSVSKRYESMSSRTLRALNSRASAIDSARTANEASAVEDAVALARAKHVHSLRVSLFLFTSARLLNVLGGLLLVGGLVAGVQMAAGRVLYDHKSITTVDDYFRMSEGVAEALEWQLSAAPSSANTSGSAEDILSLKNLPWEPSEQHRYWWRARSVVVSGFGAAEDIGVPQPMTSVFQRLVSGRYALLGIDGLDSRFGSEEATSFSVAGDSHLAAIRIKDGQEVVFRMRTLGAFTDGVQFRSIYSTHAANAVLGLGSFYTVASGSGWLVLITTGQTVTANGGKSVQPVRLLAWDRRLRFAFDQAGTSIGVWLNTPSLVLSPSRDSAVIDQDATSPNLLTKVWRLLRYLLLPF